MCEHAEHHRHHQCDCEDDPQHEERCGCAPGSYHHEQHGGECGCGGRHHGGHDPHDCGWSGHRVPWEGECRSRRRFATREERIAWLERYLKELRAEAQAVEERITEWKAQS